VTTMPHESLRRPRTPGDVRYSRGLTLVEVMVAMTISLLILAALVSVFVNMSRSTNEMAKTNSLIENGRFAIQLLQDDLVHAGFWGGYVPQFDNLSFTAVPADAPTAVPNPCAVYNTWDSTYRNNILGIPVQSYDTLPTGTGCLSPLAQKTNSDVLVVRHADICVPGVGNCAADVAGKLYLQVPFCAAEANAGTAQSAASNSITLSSSASSVDTSYVGLTIRTVSGVGAGQNRTISAYTGSSRLATVSTAWTTIPDSTTTYSFEYMLGTNSYPLHTVHCVGTGSPPTLPININPGTGADKRKWVSNIYYISNIANPDQPNQVIPTLVVSQFDFAGGTLAQQAPLAMIDGIDAFRVELGIDSISKSGALVDYTQAVVWTDPINHTQATNRGDGEPDTFVRCTTAVPCTAAQLSNVVAVKIYVLARSRDTTPGYTDTKSYCLGELNPNGTCPAANQIAAANDSYKRHVFSSSMRLINVSGRRETP
jgi:prepilin-type N-terminal cleavage/methylation domain-containing protein